MRGFLQTKPSKIQIFNLFSWTHEIFKVSKYKENIKLETIYGHQTDGVVFKRGHLTPTFLPHMPDT